ncbi:M48 family metallopeptidase [Persicimonas caeni]|uniref:M48 family metallopeptidase n=1 Tax=Persicimonas caeni TaxID=2292766 RepID=A0A4Y6PUV8_PERCE|nr:M48 family metallopeptidase [Persicimonas caeni]QDG51889.1 M48 family metallopeptidase [Persicimonas caeni]QED33110.1 M48 family metallopeptidase [Persicimonas caeni]
MKNFFEHQDVARKNTFRLVVLFGLAVLITIVAVYFVAVIAIEGQALWLPSAHDGVTTASWFNFDALLLASIGTLALVGGGTFWKIHQLARGGGSLVCEQLGGRFVDFRTDDLAEQQLINVVEEMSIASGVSVPLLYVLDNESGINAFAAGFTPNNAAIAVSRGCLEMLNRDELQGVIAHEFSHILNGDMRMNIRMIGVLHGILMLAVTGRVLMRMAFHGSGRRSRSSRDSGGGVIWLGIIGLALFIIGYVGRFFGAIIKSAISRQREYLADASAVQFTRNPKGLSGALLKIGGYSVGSRIHSPEADEVSHLFFGDALEPSWLSSVFATHPPLKDRIRRVDPGFSGAFPKVKKPKELEQKKVEAEKPRWEIPVAGGASQPAAQMAAAGAMGLAADGGSPQASEPQARRARPRAQGQRMNLEADAVLDSMGQTSEEHVDYARGALEAIPAPIREAARDTYSAAAVVFALLMDVDPSTRHTQLEVINRELTRGLAEETRRYANQLEGLDPVHRLPLVEILVPALRQMSEGQHAMFIKILDRLIYADNRVSLFEFSLEKLLKHRLEASHGGGGRRVAQYYSLTPLRNDVVLLLSCLSWAGHSDTGGAEMAFREGTNCLKNASVKNKADLLAKSRCSFEELDGALDRISQATNGVKQQIVNATAHCVLADEEVTAEEAELLRAVCEVIDVPLPPFLPA